MMRTRDFLVLLVLVFTLVVSGGAVSALKIGSQSNQLGAAVTAFDAEAVPVVDKEAVVPPEPELDRASLLAAMKEKVAGRSGEVVALAEVETVTEPPVLTDEDGPAASGKQAVQKCATYSRVGWSDMPGARFKEVEGVRILYRNIPTVAPPVSATGTDALPAVTEEVLAQLPLRSAPFPSPTCIPQDVIGIALDGSLIRNDEVALYTVFGSDTLIGYTLDGYPLYGSSALPTDDCGGAMVGGTYRYYLSKDRDTIVQCFAGIPVGL